MTELYNVIYPVDGGRLIVAVTIDRHSMVVKPFRLHEAQAVAAFYRRFFGHQARIVPHDPARRRWTRTHDLRSHLAEGDGG